MQGNLETHGNPSCDLWSCLLTCEVRVGAGPQFGNGMAHSLTLTVQIHLQIKIDKTYTKYITCTVHVYMYVCVYMYIGETIIS